MKPSRLSGDVRREQILEAAKVCFARNGFARTTTKSVALAAGISEGLLFRHFPTKSALFAEILAAACEADPGLHALLELQPSTQTLVTLIRGMVANFIHVSDFPEQEQAQRLRLLISSHLEDGEFARLLFEKIGALIGPMFIGSLERAVEAGDATRVHGDPINLFWFAHHTVLMAALTKLPAVPTVSSGAPADLERALSEFILRGLGLHEAAIATYAGGELPTHPVRQLATESA